MTARSVVWRDVVALPWPVYAALSDELRRTAHDAANIAVTGLAAVEMASEQLDDPKQKKRLDRAIRQFERMSGLITDLRADAWRELVGSQSPRDAIRTAVERSCREIDRQLTWRDEGLTDAWITAAGGDFVVHVVLCLVRHVATMTAHECGLVDVRFFASQASAGFEVLSRVGGDGDKIAPNRGPKPRSGALGITKHVAATVAAQRGGTVQEAESVQFVAVRATWPVSTTPG